MLEEAAAPPGSHAGPPPAPGRPCPGGVPGWGPHAHARGAHTALKPVPLTCTGRGVAASVTRPDATRSHTCAECTPHCQPPPVTETDLTPERGRELSLSPRRARLGRGGGHRGLARAWWPRLPRTSWRWGRAWRSRDGACGLCLAACESRPQPPRSAAHVRRPDPARRCWVLAPGRCDGSAGASASAVEEAAAPLHPLPPAHADRGAGPSGHRGGRPCPLRKESACTAHGRRCPPRLTLPPGDLLVLARKLFFFTAAYYSACSLPQLT